MSFENELKGFLDNKETADELPKIEDVEETEEAERDIEENSNEDDKEEVEKDINESEGENRQENRNFAKERIDNKKNNELKEQNKFLQEQLAAIISQRQQANVVQEKPKVEVKNPFDRDIEPDSYQVWEDNRELKRKIEEVSNQTYFSNLLIETKIADLQITQNKPDYVEQKNFLIERQAEIAEMQYYGKLKSSYPHATEEQIKGFIRQQAQRQVDMLIMETVNSKDDLYDKISNFANKFGYTKQNKPEVKKPDFNKINQNKKYSNNLNGKGISAGNKASKYSLAQTNEMSVAEFLKNLNEIDYDN